MISVYSLYKQLTFWAEQNVWSCYNNNSQTILRATLANPGLHSFWFMGYPLDRWENDIDTTVIHISTSSQGLTHRNNAGLVELKSSNTFTDTEQHCLFTWKDGFEGGVAYADQRQVFRNVDSEEDCEEEEMIQTDSVVIKSTNSRWVGRKTHPMWNLQLRQRKCQTRSQWRWRG